MRTRRRIAIATCAGLVLALPLNAGEPLAMKVSPLMSMAPAFLSVRTSIEANADNRALEITAESSDFYSSTVIQLDGERAPRVSVIQIRNVPTGTYDVTSTLIGSNGRRGTVSRTVRVASSDGLDRR